MCKLILSLSLFCFFLNSSAYAQVALDKSNPNYEHDRITKMWMDSKDVPVSNEAKIVLKNRGLTQHIPESLMMRNVFIFQVLGNPAYTTEEKIWAADVFIRWASADNSYPLEYIKLLKTGLSTKTK